MMQSSQAKTLSLNNSYLVLSDQFSSFVAFSQSFFLRVYMSCFILKAIVSSTPTFRKAEATHGEHFYCCLSGTGDEPVLLVNVALRNPLCLKWLLIKINPSTKRRHKIQEDHEAIK